MAAESLFKPPTAYILQREHLRSVHRRGSHIDECPVESGWSLRAARGRHLEHGHQLATHTHSHLAREEDPILAAKAPCPAYDYELASLESSPEFKALTEKHRNLFAYLSEKGGRPVKTFIDAQYLNNTLFIENLYNMTLPKWTKKVYGREELTYVSNFAFAISSYTRKLARLKAGPLLKDIFQRFKEKSSGSLKPDRSMWVYSAHDTTVASVLNALKLFEVGV